MRHSKKPATTKVIYEIYFLIGKYQGMTKTLLVDFESIERYDLIGYLFERGYLDDINGQTEYFEVKNREFLFKQNVKST